MEYDVVSYAKLQVYEATECITTCITHMMEWNASVQINVYNHAFSV